MREFLKGLPHSTIAVEASGHLWFWCGDCNDDNVG